MKEWVTGAQNHPAWLERARIRNWVDNPRESLDVVEGCDKEAVEQWKDQARLARMSVLTQSCYDPSH